MKTILITLLTLCVVADAGPPIIWNGTTAKIIAPGGLVNSSGAAFGTGSGDFLKSGAEVMTGQLKAAVGSASAPGITFDGDLNTGAYWSATDTMDLVAGGFSGLQIKKSTGNFANIGMGATASTSDQVLLTMSRANASGGTYGIAVNTSATANAFAGWRAEADSGNIVGQFAAYAASSTIDAYVSAAVLRASGSATKLSLAGPTIKMYTNNATLTTAEEALRLNPDFSMQIMQTIATPATPSANSVKLYVKGDKLAILNDGAVEYYAGTTNWASCTVTGPWTTNTTYSAMCRRVNDSLDIRVKVAVAGGAPGVGGSLIIGLPYTVDTAKMVSPSAAATGVHSTCRALNPGTATYDCGVNYYSTTEVMVMKRAVSGSDVNMSSALNHTSPFTVGDGDSIEFEVSGLPISGW